MPVKHAFVSAKTDGADATLVRPSDWNASHSGSSDWDSVVTLASDFSVTNSLPQDVTGFTFNAAASEVWRIQVVGATVGDSTTADVGCNLVPSRPRRSCGRSGSRKPTTRTCP